jgi:hypothetical protein
MTRISPNDPYEEVPYQVVNTMVSFVVSEFGISPLSAFSVGNIALQIPRRCRVESGS